MNLHDVAELKRGDILFMDGKSHRGEVAVLETLISRSELKNVRNKKIMTKHYERGEMLPFVLVKRYDRMHGTYGNIIHLDGFDIDAKLSKSLRDMPPDMPKGFKEPAAPGRSFSSHPQQAHPVDPIADAIQRGITNSLREAERIIKEREEVEKKKEEAAGQVRLVRPRSFVTVSETP